ncbi:MAG: SAM-dependent methyltransferase [Acidocella sp. 20-57-95]|nr:MAG: SAM-dependent methyltransferase [Acidocella sp. 20-57-95]OYV57367.1 MAG: SAM-dependent methyltransferase [Acidocella sp. 21-58-7]HQT64455.1 methyltransferase domain-containing protein [Acidocella sp.]HQU05533.1 methyltransferase domain-containing protein [Acidocella sp.]
MSNATIFDKSAVRAHRDRAAGSLGPLQPVLDDLAGRLLDRLDDTKTKFTTALDFGGRGTIAPTLQARGMQVISADLSAAMARIAGGLPVAVDGEALAFGDKKFDLIIAHLSLHWVNDLPGALIQLRRALKTDGLFLASMPVLGTLQGLREALLEAEHNLTGAVNPRISPFPDLRDCAGLLQRAGFALPVADVEEIELLYANPLHLLHELRQAGETNAVQARARTTPPRALFPAALGQLPQRDGRAVAHLRMAVMTGWAS